METRKYNVWTVLSRPDDMPGKWQAHVLDVDVVTYGRDIAEALYRAHEAAMMVCHDDLERREDPLARRAPDECWEPFWELTGQGHRTTPMRDLFRLAEAGEISLAAVLMVLKVQVNTDSVPPKEDLDQDQMMALADCA